MKKSRNLPPRKSRFLFSLYPLFCSSTCVDHESLSSFSLAGLSLLGCTNLRRFCFGRACKRSRERWIPSRCGEFVFLAALAIRTFLAKGKRHVSWLHIFLTLLDVSTTGRRSQRQLPCRSQTLEKPRNSLLRPRAGRRNRLCR